MSKPITHVDALLAECLERCHEEGVTREEFFRMLEFRNRQDQGFTMEELLTDMLEADNFERCRDE